MTEESGGGTVQVDGERLPWIVQRCTDTRGDIDTRLRTLFEQIQSLSGRGMAGAANNALQGTSAQLYDGTLKVLLALDELAEKIRDAGNRYGVQDDDAANDIQTAGTVGSSPMMSTLRGV